MKSRSEDHSDCDPGSERLKDEAEQERKTPENEPAVERGERIATGKAIARGGKSKGFVPGAVPDRDDRRTNAK
ncbi:hypothetical protein [Schlesneria paludicola]|uniref:hypothetical protein n=1 Tax=Schlesneria paludicola TaxID=360056 RepID=UPI00029A55E5|nr:hypothetical protein [Schlesneria paludicola]